MTWEERIASYAITTGFPRSLFVADDGRVVGTWIMGNDYTAQDGYYGGYPAGYLRRIASLFPDKRKVLHVFAGKALGSDHIWGDTVDINATLNPTYVADVHSMWGVPLESYDLILSDLPYSVEDAEHYQTSSVNRTLVLRTLASRVRPGTHVVWLDQVLPMYRKIDWAIDAVIGMVKSTNHRFRMITVYRRLP